MGKRKRRAFTKESKAATVRLVRGSGKSVGAVARELDLTETALRDWVRQPRLTPGGGPGRAHDRGAGRTRAVGDRGDPRGESAALWQSTDSRRVGGPWLPHESEARGAADAPPRLGRAAPPALPGDDPLAPRVSHRAQRLGAAVRAGRPGSGVGHRHHLHSDRRGLAVPGGDP